MPTDDTPRMITLARQLANAPLYSPTKVTKTYGRRSRTVRTNASKSPGSANHPIVVSDDDSDASTQAKVRYISILEFLSMMFDLSDL